MKPLSNKLLFVSASILAIDFIFYNYWLDMGLTSKETPILVYVALFTFLLSIIGLFFGIKERKNGYEPAMIGIIGNGLLVALFSTVLFILFTLK